MKRISVIPLVPLHSSTFLLFYSQLSATAEEHENRRLSIQPRFTSNDRLRRSLDSNARLSGTAVTFSRNNHVIVGSEAHAGLLPSVKEDASVDGAAGALLGADGPVLLEGSCSLNGGLLHTCALVEHVGTTFGLDLASGLC